MKNPFKLFSLALLATATTVACTVLTPPKEVNTFRTLSLEIAVPEGEIPLAPLCKVTVPDYLATKQIAVRDANGKITLDEKNLWAEPLSSALKRTLPLQIAAHAKKAKGGSAVTNPNTSVSVSIMQLDGQIGGDVEILAYVEIYTTPKSDSDKAFYVRKLTPTKGGDMDAYVAAIATVVDELAEAIATTK